MNGGFAALSRDPLSVTVGGRTFLIPWRPAAQWALRFGQPAVLAVRMARDEDRDTLALMCLESSQAMEDVRRESLRLLADQTGRPWWETARLLATSDAPEILGRLTLAGVDPWTASLGQWCAATYALCVKDADRMARIRFDLVLSVPPQGFEDEWDDEGDDAEQIAAAVEKMMG